MCRQYVIRARDRIIYSGSKPFTLGSVQVLRKHALGGWGVKTHLLTVLMALGAGGSSKKMLM